MAREAADAKSLISVRHHFADVTNPRRLKSSYPLMDMVATPLSAVSCVGG